MQLTSDRRRFFKNVKSWAVAPQGNAPPPPHTAGFFLADALVIIITIYFILLLSSPSSMSDTDKTDQR